MENWVNSVNAEMPIPSQARQEWREGVTTRSIPSERRCSSHEPPAPKGEEIVSSASKKRCRHRIKSRCVKTWTTIQNRSGDLADNTANNNALLRRLKAKGNVRPFGGGNVIMEEIMYNDASTINVNSYSGYEVLNIAPNSPLSSAQFDINALQSGAWCH